MSDDGSGVRIDRVRKAFGARNVLDEATLSIAPGHITGLLGPNGAGKTTFVSIATGRLRPDAGRVSVAGVSPRMRGFAAAVGCAPQETGVYPTLTLRQNLIGFATLYGLRGAGARSRVDELVFALDLGGAVDRRADQLSGGQRRRLHTAMALVHRPTALFLDEPTVAADVASRARIVELVRSLADAGVAVLYTTHHLDEIERLGADVALLGAGRIRDLGSVDQVIARWGIAEVGLRVRGLDDAGPIPGPWRHVGDWIVGAVEGGDPGRLLAAGAREVTERGGQVIDTDIRRPSLENAYLRIVHGDDLFTAEHRHAAA